MTLKRKLSGFLLLCFLLTTFGAAGQTGQNKEDKDQKQASAKVPAVTVSRPARVRLGGFSFSAGYSRLSGGWPYYYSRYPYYYGYGWPWYYDSFFYGPMVAPGWYYPGWMGSFARQPDRGEIRLKCSVQEADVYLNDGFAGKAKDLKTLWLDPGAYNLRVQSEGFEPFSMRIYILSDKTLKIDAKLDPAKEPL